VNQYAWLLCALMFLSLSILVLIVQPYKKGYMNVVDRLLLAELGFLTVLIATFLYTPPSGNEKLVLLMVIAFSFPQLILLLTVTYNQLKGKQISQYIAGKVGIMLKQIYKPNQADEPPDADQLPRQLICPTSTTNLSLSKHMLTLKHLNHEDN